VDLTFPLWLIWFFPLVVGVAILSVGRLVTSVLPDERGRALLHYAGLFGTVMALLLAGQVSVSALAEGMRQTPAVVDAHGFWFGATADLPAREAGPAGSFALRFVLDRLSAPFVMATLLAFALVQIYATTKWEGLRLRVLRRRLGSLLVLEAAVVALMLVDGAEELAAAWMMLAAAASLVAWVHASGPASRDAVRRTLGVETLGAVSLCAALFVLAARVPDTSLAALRLVAVPQGASMLRQAGPFGLVRVELVWALALPSLAIRMGVWPLAWTVERTRGADEVLAPLLGLVAGLGPALYLFARFDVHLALAPNTMVVLVVWGGIAALVHAARALDEGERAGGGLGVVVRSVVGLLGATALVMVGMGAWSLAIVATLAAVPGVLAGAMAVGAWGGHLPAFARAAPSIRILSWAAWAGGALALPSAGICTVGLALWAALGFRSAGTPAINVAAALALGIAAVVSGIAWGRALRRAMARDSQAADPNAAEPHLVSAALALAISAAALAWTFYDPTRIEAWWSGTFATAAAFSGDFAVGPRAGFGAGLARGGVAGFVALGAVLSTAGLAAWSSHPRVVASPLFRFVAAGGRRAYALADAAPRAMARVLDLLGQLIELGVERSLLDDGAQELRRSVQRPWDRWLDREARTPGPRRAVYVLLGVALLLGWVMFKPDVTTWGPNGIHGFGGLGPVIMTSARARDADSDTRGDEDDEDDRAVGDDDPDARLTAGTGGGVAR